MKEFKQYVKDQKGNDFNIPLGCHFSEVMKENGLTGKTLLNVCKRQYLVTLEKETALNVCYWRFTNTMNMTTNRI